MYNGHDDISNHQPYDCLLNRLFRHRSKKTSKVRVTGLCYGISPVTGEFPTQRTSNAENVSIRWLHHVRPLYLRTGGSEHPCPTTEHPHPQGWGEYTNPEYEYEYFTRHEYEYEYWIKCVSTSTLVWVRVRVLHIQNTKFMSISLTFLYPPKRSLGGVYWIHPVRPSVRPSVCPSVRGSVSGW